MSRNELLLLTLLGVVVLLGVAAFQSSPGYMDADYYYAGGKQLAEGKGFTEITLWNYLDDPAGLPHPSHAYWMPLPSILAALLPLLLGKVTWMAARLPFLLTAAALPALTASLAFSLTRRHAVALGSGFLAVFSGFYLPYLTTTDTFAPTMLLGCLFFLVIQRKSASQKAGFHRSFLLGLLAGGIHLTRADGFLWLVVALTLAIVLRPPQEGKHPWADNAICALITVIGYLLVMGPWFLRNLGAFGSILSPGGSRMLWLTSYDQIFAYPADQLTLDTWLSGGWIAILKSRLWALGLNLSTAFAVQGGIFLLPLILIGAWQLRQERVVRVAAMAWLLTFLAMTLVFPFAGARGGFFHSGAAVQVVWWVLAPLGLESLIRVASERRGWKAANARRVLVPGMVILTGLFSLAVLFLRLPGWNREQTLYKSVDLFLLDNGKRAGDIAMVSNPPGYTLASGDPSIAIPDGDVDTVLAVADRYGADFLILEEGSVPARLSILFEHPGNLPGLFYVGEIEEARLYALAR